MDQVTLKPADGRNYQMHWNDSIQIGKAVIDVDGYYYFLPNVNGGGLWQAHVLKKIAEVLDNLNKEWNDQVEKYFQETITEFTDEELNDLPF